MTGLRCSTCGLVYDRVAIARHLPLAALAACRRCGGELEPVEIDRPPCPARPSPVVTAVRSAVTGRDRLPFG